MFESRSKPPISRGAFARRLFRWGSASAGLVLGSLAMGASGYHFLENIPWLDAALNAAMILTGMGPVTVLRTSAGKLFAIVYALFSGMVFLSAAALVVAPVAHRLLHRFHFELDDGG
jgi:hypothetical protein